MARRNRRRQWGMGSVYQTAAGWGIRWREGGQRHRRAGYATREDAERVLAKVMGEVAQKRAGMPADTRGAQPLGELVEDWLKRREQTHRNAADDRRRWENHLARHFARMKPHEVDHASIRRFIEERLAAGLAPGTVGLCFHNLSALFVDLVERGLAPLNPCRSLPRRTRRLIKGGHDPKDTPYVERLEDVRRVFLALPEPVNIAYALGAMAGLRTGEALGLRWHNVDLAARRIKVSTTVDRITTEELPPKDGETRTVPILDGLLPVLTAWRLRTGGTGLLVPSVQRGAAHLSRDFLWEALRDALKACGFPEASWTPGGKFTLTWYRSTRHTFASHWVRAGGSLATLARILGHSSVTITERHYVHLRPDDFAERDLATITVDLRPGCAEPGALGPRMTQAPGSITPNLLKDQGYGRTVSPFIR